MKLGAKLRRAAGGAGPRRVEEKGAAIEIRRALVAAGGGTRRDEALEILMRGGLRGAEIATGDERMAASLPLFLDTETTGLGTGPGTLAFLVGLAWIEQGAVEGSAALRVEQRLMTRFGGERELLDWVRKTVAERAGTLVTYNGRSYDMPLLESRTLMQRMRPGIACDLHLDLLHPARALWGGLLPDCRLGTLEARVLGHHRPLDLPGAEIPAAWLSFVRDGRQDEIETILAHNREDLVSLAALTALVCGAFRGMPIGGKAVQGRLGQALLRRRRPDASRRAFERSIELGSEESSVLDGLATAYRRLGRVAEEEALLRQWIDAQPPPFDPHPFERLAILLEHRKRSVGEARKVTLEALERLSLRRALRGSEDPAVERLGKRLERLNRRCGLNR